MHHTIASRTIITGRFWNGGANIKPFTNDVFTVCNVDGSILKGVAGGVTYRFMLTSTKEQRQGLVVGIGFSNPLLGSMKISAFVTDSAQKAYEASGSASTFHSSETFYAVDKDGEPTTFRIDMTATPGQVTKVTFTQV